MDAHDRKGRQPNHPAQVGRGLERGGQFPDAIAVQPVSPVTGLIATGGQGFEGDLAGQGIAGGALGPGVLENQVVPLLDDGRCRVPVERVLEDNDVVAFAKLLFVGDINEEIWVAGVKIMKRNAIERFHGLPQCRIDG